MGYWLTLIWRNVQTEMARGSSHARWASGILFCALSELLTTISQGTWQFIPTAQLLNPDKVYGVPDELESFFLVILYEGIHWVVHNKPSLGVKYLFDGVQADPGGHGVTGGKGKFCMYTLSPHTDAVLHQLRFERSPPFADILRELFLLFKSLAIVNRNKESGEELQDQDISNVKKLENCGAVVQLMKNAVERVDWPTEHDKAPRDNYPGNREACWDHI